MVTFVDIVDDGYVSRNGVLVKIDVAKQLWRVGKVILAGPKCSPKIKKGVHILFPNDRGLQVPRVGGFSNVAFLNEDRIFGICEPNNIEVKFKLGTKGKFKPSRRGK
jgi:hypothetical protein